jgi:WD repeat-containing protein 35
LNPLFQRKDAWECRWSEDDPDAFAAMEKTKMVVYRGAAPEDPGIASSGRICEFRELCVKTVLLDAIARTDLGERSSNSSPSARLSKFQTKPLVLFRDLVNATETDSSAAATELLVQFVEDRAHPTLWKLLAEHALEKLDLRLADTAFARCSDYRGVRFVRRLATLENETFRKAEVATYFKKFDVAERAYLACDRGDLAVDLRKNIGDWFRVETLVHAGTGTAGDDETLRLAWNGAGSYFYDRKKYEKAVAYFTKSNDVQKLAACYHALENFEALEKLIPAIPETETHALKDLARKFLAAGLCAPAVSAFARARDFASAVDACVALSQWDAAVHLAERHDLAADQIDLVFERYASVLLDQERFMDAIDLFQKAKRFQESARLFRKLADDAASRKNQAVRAKKLYVLSALETGKHRRAAAGVASAGEMGSGMERRGIEGETKRIPERSSRVRHERTAFDAEGTTSDTSVASETSDWKGTEEEAFS